ncbi:MAG: high-affinity choline transporter BetT, partial [Brevibacterium linens]
VTTMEYATLIFALPVTIIAYLVMASFSKVLRMERAEREGRTRKRRTTAVHGGRTPEKTWRQRLATLRSYPSKKSVDRFVSEVVEPALEAVAAEFRELDYTVELIQEPGPESGITESTLIVDMGEQRNFQYQIAAVEHNVPSFGGRNAPRGNDVYFRIEVFTQTGSEGYDLMGLSSQQIIDDVLDRYENHLSFLAYSHEHSYQSVVTPPAPPATDSIPAVPTSAEEVEEIDPEPASEPVHDRT